MAEDKFIDKAGIQRYTKKILEKINNKIDNSATGADSLLSKIDTSWTAAPTDNTYFIRQDTGGGNSFGRVKFSTLWTYIKAKVEALGYTKNTGTITGIKMNGSSKGTSGVVDLGTVITSHQDISGKQNKLTAGTNITISGATISAKDTTYSAATTTAAGLMSATDKTKLNGIATGANKTVVDTALSTTSTNPVQNKTVGIEFQGISNRIATNLIDVSRIPSTTAYGVTRTVYSNGKIVFTGTNTLSNDYFLVLMASRTLSAGKYRFTPNGTAISGSAPTVYQLYKDGKYFKGISPSSVITIDTDATYGIGAVIKSQATINTAFYPMLEVGSDAHDYVQYTGETGTLNGDVANIVAEVKGNSWITTGNLKYRKSGYIVALQGTITPSNTTMSITLGTLPEDCRPSQDINIAQAGTDIPSRQIIVQKGGSVVLLFASNCTASHTYAYNGIFMI